MLAQQHGERPALERHGEKPDTGAGQTACPLLLDASADDSTRCSTAVVCSPKYKLARFRLPPAPCLVPDLSLSAALIGDLRVSGSCKSPAMSGGWHCMAGTGGADGASFPPQVPLMVALIRPGPALNPHPQSWGSPDFLTARCIGLQHCCSHRFAESHLATPKIITTSSLHMNDALVSLSI